MRNESSQPIRARDLLTFCFRYNIFYDIKFMVSTFDLRVTEYKKVLLINNNGAKTGTNDTTEVGQQFGEGKGFGVV